jgi:AAA domain
VPNEFSGFPHNLENEPPLQVDPQLKTNSPQLGEQGSLNDIVSILPEGGTRNFSDSILDFNDLLKAKLPERKLILPWLPFGGLAMVAALRGLGKTFFAISLASCVTTGRRFMKWEVSEPTGVLYIDGEMPLGDYRDRLSGFNDEIPQKPLLILNHQQYFKIYEADLDVTNFEVQQAILNYLDKTPEVKLLILDNLSCLTKIREDKSDDWRGHFLPFLIACRRRKVAVLMVHHVNKAGDQRGTGAREDHLDSSIILRKVESENSEGAFFKVEFTKNRNVYGDEVEPFTAQLFQGENGLFEWTLDSSGANVKDRLYRLIKDYGLDGITVTEAAEELDVTKSAVSKAKQKLIEKGKIKPGKKMKAD